MKVQLKKVIKLWYQNVVKSVFTKPKRHIILKQKRFVSLINISKIIVKKKFIKRRK